MMMGDRYIGQSRSMTVVESVSGSLLAFGQVLFFNAVVLPALLTVYIPFSHSLKIAGLFICVTAIRHYIVRRFFNRFEIEPHVADLDVGQIAKEAAVTQPFRR